MIKKLLTKIIAISMVICLLGQATLAQTSSIVLRAVTEEMHRAFGILKEKGDPPPYFLSYRVTDLEVTTISASHGALMSNRVSRRRILDTDVRVGDYSFDNTRRSRGIGGGSQRLTLDDDPDAIKSLMWIRTDSAYRAAVEQLRRAKQDRKTSISEETTPADFSREKPIVSKSEFVRISLDKSVWIRKVKEFSSIFKKHPLIFGSSVSLVAQSNNKYFVSTEGTSLQHGESRVRLSVFATTKAEDGMNLVRYEAFDAFLLDGLPEDAKIIAMIEQVIKDLMALRKAPTIEPYDGPAILSGRASGVFFHEIFGHRIEGHRQKSRAEGNTFTAKVNQNVLPPFFSVADDPTIRNFDGTDLNGHYRYDDEGIKSQRVSLVQNGILKTFLLGRSPIKGFNRSNGHGRAQPGIGAVSRQGNLIIEASKTVSRVELRKALIAEIKRQGKPFGLFFQDISGGFTNTRRFSPQAFQVTPVMVYKIYPDGRPDELVRGLDLIGTPLTAFSKIIAADNKPEIFNGMCGAESGWVPVSAISPGILLQQIEVQKQPKSNALPPILPPPGVEMNIWRNTKSR